MITTGTPSTQTYPDNSQIGRYEDRFDTQCHCPIPDPDSTGSKCTRCGGSGPKIVDEKKRKSKNDK